MTDRPGLPSDASTAEQADEQALRDGLRAPRLSPEALQRIRHATEAEWRAVTQAPPRRRWAAVAAAASVVILAVAGVLGVNAFNHRGDDGAVLGTLARSEAPGIRLRQLLRDDRALGPRAELRAGQTLAVEGDTRVELAAGGNLRLARGSVLEITGGDSLRLASGELYVDIPPGQARAARFTVQTPAGEFQHVGTQFAVAIVGDQTRLRVREGSVQWRAAGGGATIDAGTEALIDGARRLTRRAMATTGRDWGWVEALAPEIDIEDRPLQEFLEWFARETGRRLEIADEPARRQAAAIRMHGSIRGLTALEALTAVMASTTLHYELPEGTIRVSSARGPVPPR